MRGHACSLRRSRNFLGNLLVRVQRLHGGEEQHIPDAGRIGEQHHQPVQAKAQAAGGSQAIFQSVDIIVVHLAGVLGVGCFPQGHLLFKALLLIDGIVQLAEGIAEFHGVDEILKPLGEGRLVLLPLGQGAVFHRIVVDEGGLDQLLFHKGIEQLHQHSALGGIGRHQHILLLCGLPGVLVGLPGIVVAAGILFHRFHHGQTLPMAHINGLTHVGDGQAAADGLGQVLIQIFHQVHHALVIGEGLVQLDAGEFRVVLCVHAFVAEDTAHFIHPVKPAHDEPLEGQLGFDAQVHIHIQCVVMGDERTGGSADL